MSLKPASGRYHWALWLGVAAIVVPLLSLVPYLSSGTELARARNALVLDRAANANSDWSPPNIPPGFLVDEVPPDPMFVRVVQQLHLAELPTDWARAVAISRHLLGSSRPGGGGAIQAGLRTTYRRITEDGGGYCADFVSAFSAVATAAGMPMRSWAFSFDGFGGHGHILPEIWNRQAGAWQLLDVFNNAYFTQAHKPLSVREFRAAMLGSAGEIQMHRLDPNARPGYVHEHKAWDYYRRGLPEWYLWWGNNPFSYEQTWSVRILSPVSRALAQLGAIFQGMHPRIHILVTDENRVRVDGLYRVRVHLISTLVSVALGVVVIVVIVVRRRALLRGRAHTNEAASA